MICHCEEGRDAGERMRSVSCALLYCTLVNSFKRTATASLLILSLFFSSFTLRPLILLYSHPPPLTDAHRRSCTILTTNTLQSAPLSPFLHPCSSFHAALHNKPSSPLDVMSVAEIKEQAKQQVQRGSRGVSAISLIHSAKGQVSLAQSREGAGDLKGALSAFTKAASLTRVFMDSAEFKAENLPGKRGVLWKEFTEFQQVSGTAWFLHPPSSS